MSAPASDALRQLLLDLPGTVPVGRIDAIWIFPPREIAGRESGLVVLSLLDEPEPSEQRRVVTLRYEAERTRQGIRRTDQLAEQGTAPVDRIPRLIEGVLARLGDAREDPVTAEIGGDAAQWRDLLLRLQVPTVDPAGGE